LAAYKKQKAQVENEFAKRAKAHQFRIAEQRKLFDQIKGSPLTTSSFAVDTAQGITVELIGPRGVLKNPLTHVEAWNNWAKFSFNDDKDTNGAEAKAKFYFALRLSGSINISWLWAVRGAR